MFMYTCQIGNLRALLDLPGLPLSIQPYIKQLKSLYDPIPFEPEIVTKYQDDYLELPVFNELIAKLNKKFSLSDSIWVLSTAYSQEVRQNRSSYSPVTSRAKFLKNHRVADEVYSVSNVNKNNSVIALKPGLQAAYGQIEKIFQHSRQMPNELRWNFTLDNAHNEEMSERERKTILS
ncbi:hypothetical protein KEM48_013003 [Puccinia striiformis f. sp. tritici PST-130]|nr:hypothetical protein KEM48_013003 [Puccinia striiformis f. sp. tritici PST-130]